MAEHNFKRGNSLYSRCKLPSEINENAGKISVRHSLETPLVKRAAQIARRLRVADQQQEDDTHFLNVHAEQGNQLRSKAAVRRI